MGKDTENMEKQNTKASSRIKLIEAKRFIPSLKTWVSLPNL